MRRLPFPFLIGLLLTCQLTRAQAIPHAPETQVPESPHATPAKPADPPQPSTPDSLLAQGKSLYQANNLTHAEIALRTYLAAKPASAEAAYLLARLLERTNAPRDSLGWFTKAAALSTPSSEDLRFVGMDYVLLNDYPDALHWLGRSVQADPANAEAWYDLARAFMMQDDYTAAEKALRKSLALHQKSVKAEDNLGVVYEAQNRASDAAEAYQRAIAWQASDPHPSEQPLLNYGKLLLTQGRSADALPLLAQAAELAPRDPKTHEHLAHALDQQGQLPQAEQHMQQAIDLDPGNAALHFQLGQMYRRSGELEKSRQELAASSRLYGTRSTPDR